MMVTVMVEWVTLMSRSRTDRPASGSSLAMASRRVSHAHTAIQSSVLVLGTNGASRTPGTARKTSVEDSEVVEVVQGEVAPVAVEVVAEAVAVVALAIVEDAEEVVDSVAIAVVAVVASAVVVVVSVIAAAVVVEAVAVSEAVVVVVATPCVAVPSPKARVPRLRSRHTSVSTRVPFLLVPLCSRGLLHVHQKLSQGTRPPANLLCIHMPFHAP